MSETMNGLRIVTVNIPQKYLDFIAKLQEWGITPSRSEYVRIAVMKQITEDLKIASTISFITKETKEALDPTCIRVPNKDGSYTKYNFLREA